MIKKTEFNRIFHFRRNQLVATPRNYKRWQWNWHGRWPGGVVWKEWQFHVKPQLNFFWHFSLLSFYSIKSLFLNSLNIYFYRQSFYFSRKDNLPLLVYFSLVTDNTFMVFSFLKNCFAKRVGLIEEYKDISVIDKSIWVLDVQREARASLLGSNIL